MESLNPKLQPIINDLREMHDADQIMRNRSHQDPDLWDERVDFRNTESLKRIIKEIGWPSISKVGEFAAHCAWLIAQHADHDPPFQKECLALMKMEAKDDVRQRDLAFLDDRIAVAEGRPQKYGTQFHRGPDGKIQAHPLLDPERIESFRTEVGLEPFHEYKRIMEQYE